uniref:Exoribonuclease phosphorolytic domain-containing protein n=2 Tax=Parascaris univalens TaxID=6257 RepID=A0A915B4Y6_PARUN
MTLYSMKYDRCNLQLPAIFVVDLHITMEVQCTSMPSSSSGIDSTISKLRQLRAELSFLPRTDGSCALEQGNTVMWASINGPGDVPSSKRLDEKLYIEVVYRHGQSNLCSVEENRILSSILEQTVDTIQYPHKMLAVTIQEMQSDGSEMAAGVTAVCLALLDSGIIMNGIFCGICVAHCDDTLILDPCRKIIINADSLFTFVFKSSAIDHKVNLLLVPTSRSGQQEWLNAKRGAYSNMRHLRRRCD